MMGNFLSDIERFLARYDMKSTVFGQRALGDSGFVFDLRRGRSPRLNTAERVVQWMADEARRHKQLRPKAPRETGGSHAQSDPAHGVTPRTPPLT
jgi:hypothetical protein